MHFDNDDDFEWFIWRMAGFIRRIKRLHEIGQDGRVGDLSVEIEKNWVRVHTRLMALHEHVAGDQDHAAISALLERVDLDLVAMEALIEASLSSQRCGTLH